MFNTEVLHNRQRILDNKKGKVGSKWTVQTEEKKEEARALVKENLWASLTHLAQQLGVSKTTTYRILRGDIGLFPYKVHVVQKLSAIDKAKCLQFAEEFGTQLAEKPSMLDEIWFTDECYFWLNGFANKQNMRLWSDENRYAIHEAQLHHEKITIWATISAHGIIGPVFLRETVNAENYRTLLENDICPELENRGHLKKAIFQQDEVKPHTSNENLLFLRMKFGKRVISNRFANLFHCSWFWLPYSLDLNICDFFLWGGYLKDRVNKNNPQTLDELETEILRTILNIPYGIFELEVHNFLTCLEHVVEGDGRHIEQFS